jgi:adenosylhomocysteinase
LEGYFSKVIEAFPFHQVCHVLVVTHLLGDRPAFLSSLNRVADISRVIAIPYSIHEKTYDEISKSYAVDRFTLKQMEDGHALLEVCSNDIQAGRRPLAILEVGGYYAAIGNKLRGIYGHEFLGSVEDTEGGHRRYEKEDLQFPVVSVARSILKKVEDKLIGPSVLFSVEKFLRQMGQVLSAVEVGVLGYGKIGESVARAAASRGCRVLVYDINPYKRLLALADGFRIPDREFLLRRADIIIGATGSQSLSRDDFHALQDNALLASASSRKVEFDLGGLEEFPHKDGLSVQGIQEYELSPNKRIYLAAGGQPVNFVDGAVVGPVLALVQSELLLGLRSLINSQHHKGLLTVKTEEQEALCNLWISHFGRQEGGQIMNMAL